MLHVILNGAGIVRIAVCDDEQLFIDKIKGDIEEQLLNPANYSIEEFHSGEALIQKYNGVQMPFDIIFLDIEMNGMSGIETAKFIRQKDNSVLIVFLTRHQEFAISGYEVKAFRYILKSEPNPVFMRHLGEVFKEYSNSNKTLFVRTKDMKIAIKFEKIIYIEVYNRKIIVHTDETDYEYYAKLADIEHELAGYSFVKTNKSYLINLAYVKLLESNYAILKNGRKLSISRRFKTAVEHAFVEFLIGR